MENLQVGRARLTWLRGGVTFLDGGAMFGVVPKPLWSKKYPSNNNNQIELRTDPILVEIDNRNYLIDTGIGAGKLSDKQIRNFGVIEQSYIENALAQIELTPDDIDAVLMTHLHFDHACGLTKKNGDSLTSVFQNAIIYTSSIEWKEMQKPNIRSSNTYWENNWVPIVDQVHVFDKEIEITPGLKMIHTGGHSNGHSILVFEEGNECFIHMADIMPTHAHQNKLWALAYDDYPVTSVHEKEKWMKYGYDKQAWYTFYHDAYYRAIQFNKNGEIKNLVERTRYTDRN
ncbi:MULTISPECIES: YtnP family quorum-quenching lactonase [Virgibacillus]|uniref:N-acyl homoserine lactonase n=2 Tax=Virgibacillus TaxID=84406 RepID=A0A024Q9U7_9BACI|nr:MULTISPECIES: MBL fold metallo-hydrolase [Virgibacillus]EQB35667.1 hypothetical protein M948_11530 [Virgibacillus sp. CM-4]MYL41470.1 MBL fold metallo-hydrolase [Virgibacillus massiliensis]GGJ50639.1 putative quorum-quenching lactonase YtnP [Virgibacillus kapii]CDQ39274.1 N-acyl homoserine lactonase [Virgibacillus massiliensis]